MNRQVPSYRDLPEISPGYQYAWDYFNSLQPDAGTKDQLGTLNFLTDERKARAARETIIKGKSISLDLPIDFFTPVISAFGGRAAPVHTIDAKAPFSSDDSVSFNTQSTSQWDGFRHFGFRKTCQHYNGHTPDEFSKSNILGIQAWVQNGGICGRGILVDFCAWAQSQGESLDVNSGRAITLPEVKAVLKYQQTEIRPGDILLFRTGWLKWYNETEATARYYELCEKNESGNHRFIGLAQESNFVEWIWNNQIAAVAGDQVAFECTPPPEGGFGWLHEHLLAGLGCPIGELFDTEKIADFCRSEGNYEFFLSSTPLHIDGGVASPANALALI